MTLNPYLTGIMTVVFAVNQYGMASMASHMGITQSLGSFFTIPGASAMEMMMPVLNQDGKTTHLQMMPTITEVLADPQTGDAVADGMAVMIAKGKPFYAPENVSFDDPVAALASWGSYADMELAPEMENRYNQMTGIFPCNFCCGSPTSVTLNGRCGCAHARAARGFFRYMLATYGDTYTNDQLYGEAYKWQAVWYPAGVVEDYLLATGRGSAIGHKTHGGAGADGMHGIAL